MGFQEYVIVYLFGGLTFLPLLLFGFVYLHPIISSQDINNDNGLGEDEPTKLKAGELEENGQSGVETYKAGWVFVTQEYLDSPDEINSSTQSISESSENKSAYSALYKLVQKETIIKNDSADLKKKPRSSSFDFPKFTGMTTTSSNNSVNTNSSDSSSNLEKTETTSSPVASSPSSNPPSAANSPIPNEKIRTSQRKHRFYAILKHGNLFLYRDETLKDVKHVIVLSSHFISIWPRHLSDASLFTKSSAIAILNSSKLDYTSLATNSTVVPKGSFFIYCDYTIEKEDWYFSLIRATKQSTKTDIHPSLDPSIYAKTMHFTTNHMIDLIQTLYSSEGQLQTKWLNALIGRLFLAFQQTEILHQYLIAKVSKKLNKIKTPGFLDRFVIKSLYPGDSAPFLTYPTLKEISPDGTILVSTFLTYHGNFSIEIATKVAISLGSRFKTRDVDLVLRITLTKIEGPMLIKIKPPPSERIWYAFEVEPVMVVKIEPVISSRQMAYAIITSSIEKKLIEAVKESFVLPHWDDIVFYDTSNEVYRGGIWDPSVRNPTPPDVSETKTETEKSENDKNEEKIELDTEEDLSFASPKKTKLANTLTDIGKRMKQKSSSKLDIDRPTSGSSTSVEGDTDSQSSKSATMNTLKKIGKWYFKDEKNPPESPYTPPEMISSRRIPRKSSSASMNESVISAERASGPSYEFSRFNPQINYGNGSHIPKTRTASNDSITSSNSRKSHPNMSPLLATSFSFADLSSINDDSTPSDNEDMTVFDEYDEKLANFSTETLNQSAIPNSSSPTASVSGITASIANGTANTKVQGITSTLDNSSTPKLYRKPPPVFSEDTYE